MCSSFNTGDLGNLGTDAPVPVEIGHHDKPLQCVWCNLAEFGMTPVLLKSLALALACRIHTPARGGGAGVDTTPVPRAIVPAS